uniref:Calpain-15 n=1 Tax=Panagrolaimus sp. JU765 TaxID=591449 RepID=A0AC34Q7Y7_9BILA
MCGSENPVNKRGRTNSLLSKLPSISIHSANNIIDSAMTALKDVIAPPTHQIGFRNGYAEVVPDWMCPQCGLPNSPQADICGRCNFSRLHSDVRAMWTCQKCHLQQPIAPVDFVCPLCKKKAPRTVVQSATAPELSKPTPPPRPSLPVTEDRREVNEIYDNIMEKNIDIVWLRPAEICTKDGRSRPWTVFYDPQPTDIEQGLLGNCWFVSALAVIAERPEILEQIVLTNNYNAIGVYKIRLCVDGLWKTVFVDDFFPCHKRSRSMIFAVGRNNQLWVSLIEKGLAKIYGNYAALKAGRAVEGLATLTGAPCEHIDLEVDLTMGPSEAAQALEMIWARLLSAKEANFLMGCSCGAGRRAVNDEEHKRIGLMSRHAYSILDVKQYDGARLIRLRNPWGTFIWRGEWSPGWPGWNEKSKADLYYEKVRHEQGTFWMPFERFVQYFDSVELAHVRTGLGWSDKRFSFNISWKQPKVLRITVVEPTEICFTLFQRNARTALDQVDIMILVHKEEVNGQPGQMIIRSARRCLASVRTDDMFFEPGTYVVCPLSLTHFVSEKSLPAALVMHSGKPVEARLENCSIDTFRQSLVQMTLAEGTPMEYLKNVRLYQISKNFSGLLLMVDNLHENHCVQVKANCNQSQNVLSSRGELLVADSIPPLHRQIVLILTHCEASQPFIVQHLLNQRITKAAKLGDFAVFLPDSQHEPILMSPTQQALHGPKPLYL